MRESSRDGRCAPRYLERAKENKGGGYTRVVKVNHRRGDNA
ncbi:MAG: hypothetical protein JRE81_10120, partial [Deltaproteobacteria bacterium]|nr:hypothetical protein [Deltaproteobacteria bacterium]